MRKSALFWFGLVITLLVTLGLVVLSSASGANALKCTHGADAYFYIKRQFAFLAVGIVVAVLVSLFDYHRWRDCEYLTWAFCAVLFLLLLAVFWFDKSHGSARWIKVFSYKFQPSEFAKLATVILLSVWLDKIGWKVEEFKKGTLWPLLFISLFAVPILCEPDFGAVMVVGLVGFLLMFVAGSRIRYMVPFGVAGGLGVLTLILLNENRFARLFDESKRHQVKMALAAIGNSDVWGAGLGQSMQKYLYLPEAHTDFVFAVGAEELGLGFSLAVVLLYAAFFAFSVYIARKASDRFGRFLVIGMAFIVFYQAMFNLGVVCDALPTKGVALPFFSYGGTNLLSSFFAVGMIMSVGIHSYQDRKHALVRKVLFR